MASLTIRLSASAQWGALARSAATSWPASVALHLVEPADANDTLVVIDAHAGAVSDPHPGGVPAEHGIAHATIVGDRPMTADGFTLWAQQALLGVAHPAVEQAREWQLPYEVVELELPADPRASFHARTAMRGLSRDLSFADDVLLATSELTANALQHGIGAPRLTAVRRERSIAVALSDGRPDALPVVQHLRGVAASSGRGMAIVNEISHHWGITVYHDRKVVWCEVGDEHVLSNHAGRPAG